MLVFIHLVLELLVDPRAKGIKVGASHANIVKRHGEERLANIKNKGTRDQGKDPANICDATPNKVYTHKAILQVHPTLSHTRAILHRDHRLHM
jgi:hypothetical protein